MTPVEATAEFQVVAHVPAEVEVLVSELVEVRRSEPSQGHHEPVVASG